MTAAFTVILPHKRNPGNDAALSICIDMLNANTVNDFELLISCAVDRPLFPAIDRLFRQAETEYLVFWNSDMFAGPRWDEPMLAKAGYNTIVNPILVEPAVMGIFPDNVEWDFGRRPDTFRRADFESWTQSAPVPSGEGFFAPYLIARQRYIDVGGFDLTGDLTGFVPRDVEFYAKHKEQGGRVERARAYVYHLQRYSEVAEQEKENRR